MLIPGLVRTDVAFIDRCVATVRGWRAYVASMRRLGLEDPGFPAALDWWCQQFALLRDLAIRGYPAHVVSYESFVRDPARVAAEVITWIGRGDPVKAAAAVRPVAAQERGGDEQLGGGVDPRHLAVFDELHAVIDAGRPLSPRFIEELNRTDEALRPAVLEHRARASARTVADILGRQ